KSKFLNQLILAPELRSTTAQKFQASPRETNDNNHQYSDNDKYTLYDDSNSQKYKVVLHTPGVKNKAQFKIIIEEEGKAVTVECEVIKQ
ncbi:4360_t:CDS:2, partial [Racocetra fulgida]